MLLFWILLFTSLKKQFLPLFPMKTVQTLISKDMKLQELFTTYPQHVPALSEALLESGIPCYGCHTNQDQTLQAAAEKAELSREELTELLQKLEKSVEQPFSFPLTITPKAALQIKDVIKEQPDKQILRIHAGQAGCCGNQYGLMLVHAPEKGDLSCIQEGIPFIVSPSSLAALQGATLDYIEGKHASGFRITSPAAKKGCGGSCTGDCSKGGCGGCSSHSG